MIKVLLAMQHGKLPGPVHFKELNPYIEIKDTPFYIVEKTKLGAIKRSGRQRNSTAGRRQFLWIWRCECALVMEEAPAQVSRENYVKPSYLVALSAKDGPRIDRMYTSVIKLAKPKKSFINSIICYCLYIKRWAQSFSSSSGCGQQIRLEVCKNY